MKSGGYLAGGEVTDTTVPQLGVSNNGTSVQIPAPPALTPDQIGGGMTDAQRGQYFDGQIGLLGSQKTLMDNAAAALAPQPWYLNSTLWGGVSGLVQNVFAWLANTRYMEMAETINDRRMEAQENIAGYQSELGMEYLKIQNQSNERMYGQNGYAREVEQIRANKELAALDKTLEHKERAAALRNVDRAFSLNGRSDYFYG